ncbi:hypothetical protein ACOME3_001226 [Neoechinorhynchus agilis]
MIYPITKYRLIVGCIAFSSLLLLYSLTRLSVRRPKEPKGNQTEDSLQVCCIINGNSAIPSRIRNTYKTWAKDCSIVIVVGANMSNVLGGILKVENTFCIETEHSDHLYERVLSVMEFIRNDLNNPCNWILKADDDTYIHMKNLNKFLEDKNPLLPSSYGHQFRTHYSGGAGYVISKSALKMIRFATNPYCCLKYYETFPDDVIFSYCLNSSGVVFF